jgi:hypothetical protein
VGQPSPISSDFALFWLRHDPNQTVPPFNFAPESSYDEGAVNWAFQLASGQILERSMAMN